jgi:hypothetical protein
MESGRRNRVSVGKAAAVVAEKGRVYVTKKGYVSLTLFTSDQMLLDLLERSFGGSHYKHRSGYVWVVSNRTSLASISADIAEHVDPLSAICSKIKESGV